MRRVDLVDLYCDQVVSQGGDSFTRGELLAWLEKQRPNEVWTSHGASVLLQNHRVTWGKQTHSPRYVLRCNKFGHDARWFIAGAGDAPEIIRRVCRDKAKAIVKEFVLRAEPAAQKDPKVLKKVGIHERVIEAQLHVLADTLELM